MDKLTFQLGRADSIVVGAGGFQSIGVLDQAGRLTPSNQEENALRLAQKERIPYTQYIKEIDKLISKGNAGISFHEAPLRQDKLIEAARLADKALSEGRPVGEDLQDTLTHRLRIFTRKARIEFNLDRVDLAYKTTKAASAEIAKIDDELNSSNGNLQANLKRDQKAYLAAIRNEPALDQYLEKLRLGDDDKDLRMQAAKSFLEDAYTSQAEFGDVNMQVAATLPLLERLVNLAHLLGTDDASTYIDLGIEDLMKAKENNPYLDENVFNNFLDKIGETFARRPQAALERLEKLKTKYPKNEKLSQEIEMVQGLDNKAINHLNILRQKQAVNLGKKEIDLEFIDAAQRFKDDLGKDDDAYKLWIHKIDSEINIGDIDEAYKSLKFLKDHPMLSGKDLELDFLCFNDDSHAVNGIIRKSLAALLKADYQGLKAFAQEGLSLSSQEKATTEREMLFWLHAKALKSFSGATIGQNIQADMKEEFPKSRLLKEFY